MLRSQPGPQSLRWTCVGGICMPEDVGSRSSKGQEKSRAFFLVSQTKTEGAQECLLPFHRGLQISCFIESYKCPCRVHGCLPSSAEALLLAHEGGGARESILCLQKTKRRDSSQTLYPCDFTLLFLPDLGILCQLQKHYRFPNT